MEEIRDEMFLKFLLLYGGNKDVFHQLLISTGIMMGFDEKMGVLQLAVAPLENWALPQLQPY
jgi:hypothetical protein